MVIKKLEKQKYIITLKTPNISLQFLSVQSFLSHVSVDINIAILSVCPWHSGIR